MTSTGKICRVRLSILTCTSRRVLRLSPSPRMKVRMLHPAVGEFSFPLDPGGQAVLGRRGADVEITWDRRISRRHARIWADGTRLFYEDLGSRNGSFIGSDRLSSTVELNPGMSVLLGETALLVPDLTEQLDLADTEQTHEAPAVKVSVPLPPCGTDDLPATTVSQDLSLLQPTEDMPAEAAAPKPAEDYAACAQRRYPRLVGNRLAKAVLHHREELRQLWVHDISKGGVFIETAEPPPAGTRLEVQLETPDGTLSLHGQVVHIVDEASALQYSMPTGVGLQFVDLNAENRRAIQEYVDGLRLQLCSELVSSGSISSDQLETMLQRTRTFLSAAESDELYRAVGLEATAATSAIEKRVKELQNDITQASLAAAPPQQARLQAAQGVLKRVGRLLTNEQSRLEYDFRHGYIRAKERLAAAHAGTGPSLPVLRQIWMRVSQERVDQAALLTRRAFAARQAKRWDDAIQFAKQALKLNPFFEELEKTLEAWELSAQADLSPTYTRRSSSQPPAPARSRSAVRS